MTFVSGGPMISSSLAVSGDAGLFRHAEGIYTQGNPSDQTRPLGHGIGVSGVLSQQGATDYTTDLRVDAGIVTIDTDLKTTAGLVTDDRAIMVESACCSDWFLCDAAMPNYKTNGMFTRFVALDGYGLSEHSTSVTASDVGAALSVAHGAENATFGVGWQTAYTNYGDPYEIDKFSVNVSDFEKNPLSYMDSKTTRLTSLDAVFSGDKDARVDYAVEYGFM